MTTETEARAKFWAALESDMTVMLALDAAPAEARPMTAQLMEGQETEGPVWFFTSTDSVIVQTLGGSQPAFFTFADKGHGLFATVRGLMQVHTDRAVVDALWNPFVAAWYEGGKDDPKLALLRFDADQAKIWFDANSLFAGLKMLLGVDPKADYADKVARVAL